ncbi:MAG: tRNA (guanine(46)-N(7))-methyltransferase TrmB [Alphaproteobacteria bacterium]
MTEIKQKTFFGRRRGKGMSKAKDDLIATHMPKYQIKLPTTGKIDLKSLFDFEPTKFIFEIGYGDGEHLVQMALLNPDTAFIGTEVFVNGNASILKKIIENNIKNIRIFPDDVNLLFPYLEEGVFSRIFVLYPDPWPKNRTENRRMINKDNLKIFHKLLSPVGNLFVASDHPIYIPWTLFCINETKLFSWDAKKSADFVNSPSDWIPTKYEQKALIEGRKPIYLSFTKNKI